MEKISGILPASPRIKAVDLDNSQPVRKGVPSFGRKVARADSEDRVTMTTLEKQEMAKRLENYTPRDIHNSDVPVKLANEFFVGPRIQSKSEKDGLPSVEEIMATVDARIDRQSPAVKIDGEDKFTVGSYGKNGAAVQIQEPKESLDLYV